MITLLDSIMTRLQPATAVQHPVKDWPRDADGAIIPGVAVEILPTRDGYRAAGRRSNGVARVRLHCVGGDTNECLFKVSQVRALMDGYRVTPSAGTAREDSYDLEAAINPQADPMRVEIALFYNLPL